METIACLLVLIACTASIQENYQFVTLPIALPTGTGKTVVFSHLVSQRLGRSLVLVHRDELIRQAYAKLKEISPTLDVGVVKAEEDDHDRSCVIASVQTLSRESRLKRLSADFATIVVDEAHHAAAESYRAFWKP